ncbi:MAG: histidine phosphatase family protein [Myxococcales bacterium]|nr:histidine phosphatase family protein [Myxococcales bacterium]
MRHAKAAWANGQQGDHDRPLDAVGQGEAARVGALLAARGHHPQQVISSDAVRTRETWAALADLLPDTPVTFSTALYLGGLDVVRKAISAQGDAVDCLLLLGHNPGLSLAAGWLIGSELELGTAYACVLRADADTWTAALRFGGFKLAEILTPRTA